MKNSILINGKTLNINQIAQIPFPKKCLKAWRESHSFYFEADGINISKDPKEYYPVLNSTKDDVNPLAIK